MLRNIYRKRNDYLRSKDMTYQDYLKSEHWKDIRRRYFRGKLFKRYKRGCYICGAKENLQLHHRTYKRFGRERLDDLIPLCSDCHNGVHEYQKEHPRKILYFIAKKMRQKRNPTHLARKKKKRQQRINKQRRKREKRNRRNT